MKKLTSRQKILFGVYAMILAMTGDYLLGFGTFSFSDSPDAYMGITANVVPDWRYAVSSILGFLCAALFAVAAIELMKVMEKKYSLADTEEEWQRMLELDKKDVAIPAQYMKTAVEVMRHGDDSTEGLRNDEKETGHVGHYTLPDSQIVIPFPVFCFITLCAADSVRCQPRELYWEEIKCITRRKHNNLPYANTAKERASQKLPGELEPLAARYIIGLKKMAARFKRKKSI